MAHRRSRSQRNGARGESLFADWAVEAGLSANKVEHDYGVDFHCEVLRQDEDGHETAIGETLAVWVRATGTVGKARVKINRDDAERMLECKLPVALVGVDIQKKEVAFRLLDVSMQNELRAFLESPCRTRSWKHEEMSRSGEALREQLAQVLRPVSKRRLELNRLSHSLSKRFGTAEFKLVDCSVGTSGTLTVPCLGSTIDVSRAKKSAIRRALSQSGPIVPDRQDSGFYFHESVQNFLDHVDRKAFIVGSGFSFETVQVRWEKSEAQLVMERRVLDDYWSFTHPVGICFAAAKVRRRGEEHVHPTEFIIHRNDEFSLARSSAARDFLRLLKPGSELKLPGAEWMPVERWWPHAIRVGPAVDAFEAVSSRTGVSLEGAFIEDITVKARGVSLDVLEALLVREIPLERIHPGFLLDVDGKGARNSVGEPMGHAHVPVVTEFAGQFVATWCLVEVLGIRNADHLIVGAKFANQKQVEIELLDFDCAVVPGVYFVEEWPVVPLFSSQAEMSDGVLAEFGGSLPVCARFDEET